MPIRFRCSYCNRLLGIATRKAGMKTTCPHCGNSITVPVPTPEAERTERINVDDVDELLRNSGGATVREAAVAPPPPAPAAAPPPPVREALEPEFVEPLSLPASPSAPAPKRPPAAAKPAAAAPKPVDPNDPPLFEGDVDELLGVAPEPDEEERPKPPPTSGMDAMSLGESAPRTMTISSQTATLLMVAAAVLAALAFAAGYLIAPRG